VRRVAHFAARVCERIFEGAQRAAPRQRE
jgi:hypothetical protein